MSFISILKKIGTVALGIEHVASASGLGSLIPGFAMIDPIFQSIANGVVRIEANNPLTPGADKASAVTQDFAAGLDTFQQILAARKEKLTYDAVALQAAIDAQVAAFNAMAKVKASFAIVPL